MIVYAYLSIGFPAAIQREAIEVDDNATDEQIEQEVSDWKDNFIDWGWSKEKPQRRF